MSEYIVQAIYHGYDQTLDRRIEKVAGRPCDGSGAFLASPPERDLTWDYKVKRYAEAMVKRLKAARIRRNNKVVKIRVKLYADED